MTTSTPMQSLPCLRPRCAPCHPPQRTCQRSSRNSAHCFFEPQQLIAQSDKRLSGWHDFERMAAAIF